MGGVCIDSTVLSIAKLSNMCFKKNVIFVRPPKLALAIADLALQMASWKGCVHTLIEK